jgi:hypothetical protein
MKAKSAKRYVSVLFASVVFLFNVIIPVSYASDGPNPDLAALLSRVEKLEKENANLKDQLSDIKSQLTAVSAAPAAAGVGVAGTSLPVTTKSPVSVELYGFGKVDAYYMDKSNSAAGTGADDFAMNAPSLTTTSENNGKFGATVRETRIGLKISGVDINECKLSGLIETDFYGGAEATPELRLRQAYIKATYPKWNVLAGQTWDFFSPLIPSILNFSSLWRGGNIGDRHPQLILTKDMGEVLGGKLSVQGAIVDSRVDSIQKAGPLSGALVKYENKVMDKPYMVYVSGLYGKDAAAADNKKSVVSLVTGGFTLKLLEKVSLSGECFQGSDLAWARSTNNASTNGSKGVRSSGGWLQLTVAPFARSKFNLGGGIDQLNSSLITNGTNWHVNSTEYMFDITKNLMWGVEYQHLATKYQDGTKGYANRVQTSLKYSF